MEEEETEILKGQCCRNNGTLYRFFAMINISLLGFGAYAIYDSAGSLEEALINKLKLSYSEFSVMYSIDAWVNIVFCFFGGLLIDRWLGIKLATLTYGFLLLTGHIIFSLGVLKEKFWCALLGRLVSGAGYEYTHLCLQIYCVKYFKRNKISMIMCLTLCISRLGSSAVYAISQPILKCIRELVSDNNAVAVTLFIIGSFASLTLLGGSVLACMNPETNRSEKVIQSNETKRKKTCRDFFIFSLDFWLLLCVDMSCNAVIYAFLPFSQDFFTTTRGMTVEKANTVSSVFPIIAVILAPFVGLLIDKIGRQILFTIAGLILVFVAHIILGFYTWTPYISIFLMSLAFVFFTGTIIPMYALIVPEFKLGTAYGIAESFINASFSLSTIISGLILDTFSYREMEIFMASCAVAGIVASIVLLVKDARGSGHLSKTTV